MMLSRNKLFACILTLTMALSFVACGNQKASTENNTVNHISTENSDTEMSPSSVKTLYQHGMDVVALMDEMLRSELYLTTMTDSSQIHDQAKELAKGDYTTPKAVYEITPPTYNMLAAFLEEELERMDQLSPSLQEHLNNKSADALFTRLNAMDGSVTLATVSVFTASKMFVSGMLTENLIYIYTFENGYPIVITFTKGEDGAVGASGTFLITDDISTESAETLQTSLDNIFLECTIREVEMK